MISIGYTGSTKSFVELKQIAFHYKLGYKKPNICLKYKCNEIKMNIYPVFLMSTVVETSNGEEWFRLVQSDRIRIMGHDFVFTTNKILGDEDILVYWF